MLSTVSTSRARPTLDLESSLWLLHFTQDWFLKGDSCEEQYPKSLMIDGVTYSLDYHFEPGHEADGVVIQVPENCLYRLNRCALDWLVPGLIAEKCEALIRGLPKQDRKRFLPVPQFVSSFLEAGFERTEPLTLCLENFLEKLTGQKNLRLEWPQLSGHLVMKIRLMNQAGEVMSPITGRGRWSCIPLSASA